MPPNDFVLRLVDGASDEPEQVLYSAYAKIPFTVGTNGTWRVRAADVAPVHVVVMHDGASLLVRSEGPHRAWLNGRPLEDAWVRVTTFAHLAFGAARISLIPRASGAEKVANEGATMVADSTDELLAALASERAHVPSVGDATTEVPSPLDLPASETAARAVAIRKPASEAPSKHDVPSPAAFDPYRTMVMPAPPPRPAASPPSRIAPMSLASPSMPPRTMASRSAPSSMPPAPMRPVPSRPVHVAPSTPPSRIEPSVGDPRRAPAMPHEPARAIDAGAPSRVVVPPSTEWISARSVVGTPGSGWHRPAAHVRAGAYDGSPAPATMAVPMVERSAATTSATTDRRPAPSPAVSVRSPHLERVAVAWKQASPVRKLTVALVVPATLAVLFSCLRPKADASSAQLASAPPPSSPSLASSSPPPVPSPPSSPSLPPPVPSPPSSPSPASSAPSVAPAAVAAAATPSSATPTPVAAPPASPSPSPRAPAGSGTRKTTERVALDNAAEGSYASAAELYAELAAQHPENPVFREASRILATKAKGPNGT